MLKCSERPRSASPAVHTAAPSKNTSLIRNAPLALGTGTGKPGTCVHMPGVVTRNVKVIKNIPMATTLPSADTFGENDLKAIKTAIVISVTPSKFETPRTPKIGSSQDSSRLLATSGSIPAASIG